MTFRQHRLLRLYQAMLRLYPERFRLAYADQILQTLQDLHLEPADRARPRSLWPGLFADLIRSAAKERAFMTANFLRRYPIQSHALALAIILTGLGAVCSGVMQQLLRRGANQPQEQMAALYLSQLRAGSLNADSVPAAHIDLDRSLEPFVITYDDQGVPVRSTGFLDRATPVPPVGVFTYLRTHPTDEFTWQPRPGVRLATIMHRVDGPHPGFVLVGRSLAKVEAQEGFFWRMSFGAWFFIMLLLAAGAQMLIRAQPRQAQQA